MIFKRENSRSPFACYEKQSVFLYFKSRKFSNSRIKQITTQFNSTSKVRKKNGTKQCSRFQTTCKKDSDFELEKGIREVPCDGAHC